MNKQSTLLIAATSALLLQVGTARAQQTAPAAAPAAASAKAPDSLVVYFESGSAEIRKQDLAVLDQASRTYREGQPIVMIVAGSSDSVGAPDANLLLSQRRANAVLKGLVARGIPVARFQVVAKGQTAPAVPDSEGKAEAGNRRVEISWR